MSIPLHTYPDWLLSTGVLQLKSWLPRISGAMGLSWQLMPRYSEYQGFRRLEASLFTPADTPSSYFSSCSGVYAALLLSHAIMGSLTTKFIARIQYFYVFLNIAYVGLCRISLAGSVTNSSADCSSSLSLFYPQQLRPNFITRHPTPWVTSKTVCSSCIFILSARRINHISILGTPWPNGYAFILSFLAPAWTVGKLICGPRSTQ